MKPALLPLLFLPLLVGCDQQAPAQPTASAAAPPTTSVGLPTDAWVGRWVGVEGLNLTIAKDNARGAGHYLLTMQYGTDASDSGTFAGEAVGYGIRFTRPADGEQMLRAGDGAATGLKWLAEKKDCLTVKEGEGYCRD